MKYYIGIVFRKSGHAAVTKPVTSEDEVIEMLKHYVSTAVEDVAATTYITRTSDEENLDLTQVFGNPKSRDLMQNKRFLQSL